MKLKGQKAARCGLTLIEVVIATAILTIIMMVISAMYIQSLKTTKMVNDRSEATFSTQNAVERMVDDVRNSDGLTKMDATAFVINDDLGGSTIEYSYNEASHELSKDNEAYASGITEFTATYLDKDGNVTLVPAEVVKIIFDVTATDGDASHDISTSVIVRRI